MPLNVKCACQKMMQHCLCVWLWVRVYVVHAIIIIISNLLRSVRPPSLWNIFQMLLDVDSVRWSCLSVTAAVACIRYFNRAKPFAYVMKSYQKRFVANCADFDSFGGGSGDGGYASRIQAACCIYFYDAHSTQCQPIMSMSIDIRLYKCRPNDRQYVQIFMKLPSSIRKSTSCENGCIYEFRWTEIEINWTLEQLNSIKMSFCVPLVSAFGMLLHSMKLKRTSVTSTSGKYVNRIFLVWSKERRKRFDEYFLFRYNLNNGLVTSEEKYLGWFNFFRCSVDVTMPHQNAQQHARSNDGEKHIPYSST